MEKMSEFPREGRPSLLRARTSEEQVYADRIYLKSQKYSGNSFYTFSTLGPLSSFLGSPYHPFGEDQKSAEHCENTSNGDAFVHLRTYVPGAGSPIRNDVRTLEELESSLDQVNSCRVGGTVVFLRGYQPARWLNVIGHKLSLEPEFYRRHLHFSAASPFSQERQYSDASLPSSKTHMMQLKLTTLGTRFAPDNMKRSEQEEQKMLSRLREQVSSLMKKYIKGWDEYGSELGHGMSMARNFFVLDRQHVSLEQTISICVTERPHNSKHWTVSDSRTAVVWLDFGSGFGPADAGPWNSKVLDYAGCHVEYWATTQHRPGIYFADEKTMGGSNSCYQAKDDDERSVSQPATFKLLHEAFDTLLDSEAMVEDTYYSLSEIFRFSVASEAQFLDKLQHLLEEDMQPAVLAETNSDKRMTMWNLVHNKQILDRHVQNLEEICEFLEAKDSNNWSTARSEGGLKKACMANRLIERDYQKMRRRAIKLSEDYWQSTTMLANAAMIDDSQRTISQGEIVRKLSTLGFFFLPLTFSTSIFGMNLQELNEGSHSKLGVWLGIAAASLLLAYLVLRWSSHRQRVLGAWRKLRTVQHSPSTV
ncbi:hypothetical protein BDP55DRAFT_715438 [Colletotrichum godetiae]|uniref:CorA-like Mg2+ transporter n=1 Tax=Colletotrichum godetiae TaxID=1209918 RepID=A0AAJ0AKU9_9PEZI|nr:uncharacterized protein BDP55DRAFT_715438 [Colletotrichum godetiae]KAK1675753.1 hypothetical protein BDP55DRAFT_715438 [Colletotrichum godetiae]